VLLLEPQIGCEAVLFSPVACASRPYAAQVWPASSVASNTLQPTYISAIN
jgi:hypothetical protein